MPEIKFNIGAMVDVASSKELNDAVTGLQGQLERTAYRGPARPIRKPFSSSNYQTQVVPFGGSTISIVSDPTHTPAVGRMWIVRSAFVYDALNPLTAVGGTTICGLCVGNAHNPSPAQLRGWTFTGIPAANTFNSSALHVYPNEIVYLAVGGVLGSTDLSFNFEVDEYASSEFESQRL